MPEVDLVFTLSGMLEPPSNDSELVSVGVDCDNEPISLWKIPGGHIASLGAVGSFGAPGPSFVPLESMSARYPMIQRMPNNRLLICDARTKQHRSNAWIFSADGVFELEGHVGDGIEHVLTTSSGSIWVGYFDQGIYNNGAHSSGIVRFDQTLTPDWRYPPSEIRGCYTLNVHGETAMSCYYTDFPIARIAGGVVSTWSGAPRGSVGLLQSGDAVLLFGGYQRDRVARLRLSAGGQAKEVGVGQVVGLPEGQILGRVCRGTEAHVFIGHAWYRASM